MIITLSKEDLLAAVEEYVNGKYFKVVVKVTALRRVKGKEVYQAEVEFLDA